MKKSIAMLNEAESILFFLSNNEPHSIHPDVLKALIDAALKKVQTSSESIEVFYSN